MQPRDGHFYMDVLNNLIMANCDVENNATIDCCVEIDSSEAAKDSNGTCILASDNLLLETCFSKTTSTNMVPARKIHCSQRGIDWMHKGLLFRWITSSIFGRSLGGYNTIANLDCVYCCSVLLLLPLGGLWLMQFLFTHGQRKVVQHMPWIAFTNVCLCPLCCSDCIL